MSVGDEGCTGMQSKSQHASSKSDNAKLTRTSSRNDWQKFLNLSFYLYGFHILTKGGSPLVFYFLLSSIHDIKTYNNMELIIYA